MRSGVRSEGGIEKRCEVRRMGRTMRGGEIIFFLRQRTATEWQGSFVGSGMFKRDS